MLTRASRDSLVGDHFRFSRYLDVRFSGDTLGRNQILVTLKGQWVNKIKQPFSLVGLKQAFLLARLKHLFSQVKIDQAFFLVD